MLNHVPFSNLGHANYGWLDARHHFSFASYHNSERLKFGVLRVINDDIIKSGEGFSTHSHKNMEIITYVRKGAITHRDSNGNVGRTEAGDVQVMSAGTGISHSEFNLESEDTNLFQIWIEPNELEVEPRWDSYQFPQEPTVDSLKLIVSGDDSAPLSICQDAFIYAGHLLKGSKLKHPIRQQAYVLVSEGSLELNGHHLEKGDGLEMTEESSAKVMAISDVTFLIIDIPNE